MKIHNKTKFPSVRVKEIHRNDWFTLHYLADEIEEVFWLVYFALLSRWNRRSFLIDLLCTSEKIEYWEQAFWLVYFALLRRWNRRGLLIGYFALLSRWNRRSFMIGLLCVINLMKLEQVLWLAYLVISSSHVHDIIHLQVCTRKTENSHHWK